ncbi:sensor histidine kinase [Clostridium sp. Cult1]|uniref:sensor histidine kinase n=1 Tax=Clostridium sp. Cult1 TaxID=2079002 RepID=UPI001F283060|nr:HAMP domain-containing sensor histidine kinase [Clostridium sp. Cult1]
MKWKILLRFLLILVLSVIIAFNINIFIIYRFFLADDYSEGEWNQLGNFSLTFDQYIFEEDGNPTVKREGIRELNLKNGWIHNLSHDLKTPLASIKGYGELMADEEYILSQDEIKEYSHIIKEKAEYMEKLLGDLKLTQVLKRGLIPINHKKEDLVEVIRDITIDVLNNPNYQERRILFNPKKEKIIFFFDRSLLQRAFTNLIYNSIVHNDEDTEIIITMEKKDKIYIQIEDNGKGISKEDLDNLFEKYYRGTNTGESHKGSGLGMTIAKQIIEVHDGEIEVESTLGVGTKIDIIFPLII